ncbi:MAG: hypothetical protein FWC11_02775 [Firmicutes bacterium]|nr:hypothetical protein [Bacillota bacterium]MCL2255763.1 hypothetical protein [Bacillota bacterium]
MLKSAFANYGKNFKFFPIVIGVTYFSIALIFGTILIILNNRLPYDTSSLFSELGYSFSYAFSTITIQDFAGGNILSVVMSNLVDNLTTRFDTGAGSLATMFFIAVLLLFLSIMLAGILLKMFVRKSLKNTKTRKGIGAMIIRLLISLILTTVISVAVFFFFHLIFVFLFLYLILTSIASIVEIKIIFFKEKKMKDFLKPKNIFLYLLVFVIFFTITIGFIVALSFIINFLIAILIGIPFFIYFNETTKYTLVEYFRNIKLESK